MSYIFKRISMFLEIVFVTVIFEFELDLLMAEWVLISFRHYLQTTKERLMRRSYLHICLPVAYAPEPFDIFQIRYENQ
jgi:hypothetical protein